VAAAQLVEYVAKSLADNPDGVSVEVEEDGDAIILRLLVDEEDMGRVIGRNGSIAKAHRRELRPRNWLMQRRTCALRRCAAFAVLMAPFASRS